MPPLDPTSKDLGSIFTVVHETSVAHDHTQGGGFISRAKKKREKQENGAGVTHEQEKDLATFTLANEQQGQYLRSHGRTQRPSEG